jgi:SAM-dependent methyltransferase
MSRAEHWLAATWPFVHSQLPAGHLKVLEIGCGPSGGFVPSLLDQGHDAVGVDPEAPEGADYRQVEFERFEPRSPVDAVIACTSLHHVADLDEVLRAVEKALVPGGTLIVIEWASERFDLPTAQWCFERLPEPLPDEEPDWLTRHRDRWQESGDPWDVHFQAWRQEEGLHNSDEILRRLDERFARHTYRHGPYFFPDLAGTTMADEQAAIDAGQIQPTGIQYAGSRIPEPTRGAGEHVDGR